MVASYMLLFSGLLQLHIERQRPLHLQWLLLELCDSLVQLISVSSLPAWRKQFINMWPSNGKGTLGLKTLFFRRGDFVKKSFFHDFFFFFFAWLMFSEPSSIENNSFLDPKTSPSTNYYVLKLTPPTLIRLDRSVITRNRGLIRATWASKKRKTSILKFLGSRFNDYIIHKTRDEKRILLHYSI